MNEQIHEDAIVQPYERIKLGSLLQSIAREAGRPTTEIHAPPLVCERLPEKAVI